MHYLPLGSLEAEGAAEGRHLLLTSLAAWPEEQEHWHICQHLQWEEVRGTSTVAATAHGVEQEETEQEQVVQKVPPELHCGPSGTEGEGEAHLADSQSYCRCSEG